MIGGVARTTCAMLLAMTAFASAGQGARDLERQAALREFHAHVESYLALHRRLEAPLPPLHPTKETLRTYVSRQLLANAIRKARPNARQGDIFTVEVEKLFRTIIADAVAGRDVEAMLAELHEEHSAALDLWPEVNESYPPAATHEMPCFLLQVLPALEADLEYRVVGRHLLLWDSHANLVIDFLPNAFAKPETTD